MKRLGTLLVVALIAFAIIFFLKRPEVLQEIWLWLVGLAGGVGAVIKKILNLDENKGAQAKDESISFNNPELEALSKDDFEGVTVTVLRYVDDGSTTLGLLYINGEYYCYSLEDSFNAVKIAGETRIPAGEYSIDFKQALTPLTQTYRDRFDWFSYHLEIQSVPHFENVYIHSGGDHQDTKGCLLISDSLNASEASTFFTNSKNTFKDLYKFLESQLQDNVKVRLIIRDEDWVSKLTA